MDRVKFLSTEEKNILLQNAANASSEGITISDMSKPDRPLIYVNEGFQRLTGYSREEVVGLNCRFLQGEGTDQSAVAQLREAIKSKIACKVELLNYKKDGSPFWNRLAITPIKDEDGKVTHYVGIQSDISQLKETKARLQSANLDLQLFQRKILAELDQAKLVQEFLLPSEFPNSNQIKFASLFVPMDQIGGDFFDVIELTNDDYGILIADVTGHGIPAALLTFMSSTTLKNASSECLSPMKTLALTNKRLFRKMPGDAFVTMFYAVYNSQSKRLVYTQAGHPEAYIVRASKPEVIALNTGSTFIGAFSENEISFTERSILLEKGDKLILYTDAIIDAIDNYSENDNLKSLLLKNRETPLDELFKEIYEYGLKCSNQKSYPDDFSMLGMEVL